ncbi:MAG: acetyl-CoA carboxylase biotin carboxylase subunit [Bacilli bacterium]|nr:acetyl-CoA carboxylase biotin carboxylase subunit [Bacilli bacterium]
MQNKVLIANRGEIALRIIRACKELGIATVAVYSKADKDSLHVKFADEAICIGNSRSNDSYLNMNRVISAALSTGCNAIHPGYGFLSENERFVSIVEKCGLKFVGPTSEVIAKLGNKAAARAIAKLARLPIVEGSDGVVDSLEEGLAISNKIGYPIMIKASNGGGGKGITIVYSETEFRKTFGKTMMEAKAAFGDSRVYIEKYIENPKHIEVQILGDNFGNVVQLGERDCSMQRNNQKVIEESPCVSLNPLVRRSMGFAAVRLAKAVKYTNAGTVEFIVDKDGKFYFIEMNTRIQVEHPVTEAVTGIDLVKEQLNIAFGSELSMRQYGIKTNGHSIECRINAEDVQNNFRPSPGTIKNLVFPGGNGIRIDSHIYSGYEVPPFYDSMLAKLIVHAPTRKEAIRKMRMALEQFIVDGIITNVDFLYVIMHNPEFVKGNYNTSFIKKVLEEQNNG